MCGAMISFNYSDRLEDSDSLGLKIVYDLHNGSMFSGSELFEYLIIKS